ncbi:hypothetical protein PCE1_002484 [Barthelona sp. PCE]
MNNFGVVITDYAAQRAAYESLKKQKRPVRIPSIKSDQNLPCGLSNTGNSCYLSTILQLLFYNIESRRRILDIDTREAHRGGDNVLYTVSLIQKVFIELMISPYNFVTPQKLTQILETNNLFDHEQEDVTEFFNIFLKYLEPKIDLESLFHYNQSEVVMKNNFDPFNQIIKPENICSQRDFSGIFYIIYTNTSDLPAAMLESAHVTNNRYVFFSSLPSTLSITLEHVIQQGELSKQKFTVPLKMNLDGLCYNSLSDEHFSGYMKALQSKRAIELERKALLDEIVLEMSSLGIAPDFSITQRLSAFRDVSQHLISTGHESAAGTVIEVASALESFIVERMRRICALSLLDLNFDTLTFSDIISLLMDFVAQPHSTFLEEAPQRSESATSLVDSDDSLIEEEIDESPKPPSLINDDCSYILWGLWVHSGSVQYGGHWYTLIRIGDDWVKFDDERVKTVDQIDVETLLSGQCKGETVKVVFYSRKGTVNDLKRPALDELPDHILPYVEEVELKIADLPWSLVTSSTPESTRVYRQFGQSLISKLDQIVAFSEISTKPLHPAFAQFTDSGPTSMLLFGIFEVKNAILLSIAKHCHKQRVSHNYREDLLLVVKSIILERFEKQGITDEAFESIFPTGDFIANIQSPYLTYYQRIDTFYNETIRFYHVCVLQVVSSMVSETQSIEAKLETIKIFLQFTKLCQRDISMFTSMMQDRVPIDKLGVLCELTCDMQSALVFATNMISHLFESAESENVDIRSVFSRLLKEVETIVIETDPALQNHACILKLRTIQDDIIDLTCAILMSATTLSPESELFEFVAQRDLASIQDASINALGQEFGLYDREGRQNLRILWQLGQQSLSSQVTRHNIVIGLKAKLGLIYNSSDILARFKTIFSEDIINYFANSI